MITVDFGTDTIVKMAATIVTAAPDSGYSLQDVATGLKILDKLNGEATIIEFEDAEHAFLRKRIGETRWRQAHPDIVELNRAFNLV